MVKFSLYSNRHVFVMKNRMAYGVDSYETAHDELSHLFVLRFYGPVNPMGHVERGQFT